MNAQVKPHTPTTAEMRATLLRAQSKITDSLSLIALAGDKAQGSPDVACALLEAVADWLDKIYFQVEEVADALSPDATKGDSND
jgi:hypothetical protein